MDLANIQLLQTNDRTRLTATQDHLFLLRLLIGRRPGWKYCTRVKDSKSDVSFCLAEDGEGQYFHPLTGETATASSAWIVKERVRYKKVAARFFGMGYGLRQTVTPDLSTDMSIRARGITIIKGGKVRRLRHFLFSRFLKYPLGSSGDPLLECRDAYLARASARLDAASMDELQHPYFCPIDGIVAPMEIEVGSPDWTWQQLCGRQWTSQVCPKCLFEFRRKLTLMN